jgi:microcystin-dependent protein
MSEPYLGEIRMFAGNFAINGWQMCNGQLLSISQYAALFSILGTTYGGNGQTTFALPDLRGRVALHQGQGLGLSQYVIGESAGTENVTLISTQMPQHSHQINASTGGNQVSPSNNYPGNEATPIKIYSATGPVQMNPGVVAISGGSQPHPNLQPFLCVTFLIAMVGIFPSRN